MKFKFSAVLLLCGILCMQGCAFSKITVARVKAKEVDVGMIQIPLKVGVDDGDVFIYRIISGTLWADTIPMTGRYSTEVGYIEVSNLGREL